MHKTSSTLLIIFFLSFLAYPDSIFPQEKEEWEYVPGELLVKFRPGTSRRLAQATHTFYGSRAIKRFRNIHIDHIKIPENLSIEEAVALYGLDPDVEYVEPNYIRRGCRLPNDPDFGRLWGLHNTGQTGGTADADIDAPEAWDKTTGNSSVAVAILDTGADLDHGDLLDNIWLNSEESVGDANGDGFPGIKGRDDDGDGLVDEDSRGRQPGEPGYTNDLKNDDDENGYVDDITGWDFVNEDNDPDDDNAPDYHGTHVSGTVAARGDNSVGIPGVTWSTSIIPLKILDNNGIGDIADEIDAINYAVENGARIINASFGGSGFSNLEYNAIDFARQRGVLFIAAAGNEGDGDEGSDIDEPGKEVYPASYDLDNIISVAATDHNDELANFSNFGMTFVDVAGPGVEIYSTIANEKYGTLSGTSMAVPHVSGLAALIWARGFEIERDFIQIATVIDTNLTYKEVKDRILNGVDLLDGLNGKILTGGRINAGKSILEAAPSAPTILSATPVSRSQIDLVWTDNSPSAVMGLFSDTALDEATSYSYRVRAFNNSGNSTYSNVANATTFPAAPSDLSAKATSKTQIDLSWTDNSSGEGGFSIERKTGSGGTYAEIAKADANTTSHSDSDDLNEGTTYVYRVSAFNSSGNSDYSNEARIYMTFSSSGGGGGGSSCFVDTAVHN